MSGQGFEKLQRPRELEFGIRAFTLFAALNAFAGFKSCGWCLNRLVGFGDEKDNICLYLPLRRRGLDKRHRFGLGLWRMRSGQKWSSPHSDCVISSPAWGKGTWAAAPWPHCPVEAKVNRLWILTTLSRASCDPNSVCYKVFSS